MYQRRLCPSMGAIRRSVPREVAGFAHNARRSFHQSSQQSEDKSGPSPTSRPPPTYRTRRTRNDEAASKVASLNANRSMTPNRATPAGLQAVRDSRSVPGTSRPLIRREFDGPPSGQLVKAPANLRIGRNAPGPTLRGPNPRGPNPRGPNLRGRGDAARGESGNRPAGRAREAGPKKRERKQGEDAGPRGRRDKTVTMDESLSDGMVQHLMRIQRKEWDRVPYVPMYAPGSRAVQELQEDAKKIFQGEVPRVKTPGRLEKVLGIAGMHGA